jgi:uncharacterized FlgJ-related protein
VIWILAWTILTSLPAWTQTPPETGLTCQVEGVEQCKDARFQLGKVGNEDFAKMFEVRRLKFIDWIKPVALYLQGVTGMPASLFIAQAGHASEWGASPAFRNNNNIFKHMCWLPKSTLTGEVDLGGKKFSYKATCGVEKTFGSMGRPFKFPSREDSILAYLHLILTSPSKNYRAFQDELKRGLKALPPHQASFRAAGAVLNAFSADAKYVAQIQSVIQVEKLAVLDVPGCWFCLMPKGKVSP